MRRISQEHTDLPERPPLVLASRSPRRGALLAALGFSFQTSAADIDERPHDAETGIDFALRMAREKAQAVAPLHPDAVILGADTDIELDGRMLGKPQDEPHCVAMLRALSGRDHEVHTAVCVLRQSRCEMVSTTTRVRFGEVSEADAKRYWRNGEPRDKAGGYAIQGVAARWVRAIEGSYSGVIGLPMVETVELLDRFGVVAEPDAAFAGSEQ